MILTMMIITASKTTRGMVIPKMRAELAEEEEVVAPLMTKEVPTTLKSGMLVVDVCTFSVKDVKS